MKEVINNKKVYKERRQELRNNATDTELLVWQKLKSSQVGVKFRRQHSLGDYIVDFYCPRLKLVIELDGSQHYEPQAIAYDNIHTEYLNSLGIIVIRYDNHSVLTNIDAVVADIFSKVSEIRNINTKAHKP